MFIYFRLRVRCRLLIGKALIVDEFNPHLSCTITVLNEKQAEKLKSNNSTNANPKGIVFNNIKSIEYIESTNKRVVSFQDIKLDKMERTTRTNTVNIADEKYTLVFTTSSLFKKGELKVKLLAVSLPFIAIVHGNQESQAWAAVLWDSLPIIPDSHLLNTPRVYWNDLAEQLNKKFKEIVKLPKKRSASRSLVSTNEEKALTKENIMYLYYMVMNYCCDEENQSSVSVTWDAIFRDKLPGKSFSFWDWFYSVIKLIQESLSTHWNNKIIFGFIDKETAISELRAYPPGTFILRFSGSQLGKFSLSNMECCSNVLKFNYMQVD